jgi:eukaryotic-like serine/threonine-protein kinase
MRDDLVRFTDGQPVAATATNVMAAVGADPTRLQAAAGGPTGVLPATEVRSSYRPIPPPPPDDSRAGWYALIAVVLAVLLIGGYFLGKDAGWFGSSTKTVTVPSNLKGMPVASAQSELSGLGFTNVKTAQASSSSVGAGDVISSTPAAGTSMKSNALLTLSVSAGAVQVDVPNVAGEAQSNADQTLFASGFVPTDTLAYSSTVAPGTVISTDPAGGTKAAQGAHVTVVVSNGVKPVQVPSVVGESPAQAGADLAAAGLKVGQTSQQPSATVPAGQVTGTNPAAGTSVPTNSTVVVYVSSGPPTTTVPNLTGDTQAQAQQALQQAKLQGQPTTVTVTDPGQDGKVQTQSPAAGTTEPQGSTVNYQVGTFALSTTTTGGSSTTTTSTPGIT